MEGSFPMNLAEKMSVPMECVASLRVDVESVYERIAAKAHEYFMERGCIYGHDVDDWIRAEHELLLKPTAQLRRDDSDFIIDFDLPGTDPADLQIRLTSRQMLVITAPFERRQIFRIVRFAEPINSAAVRAAFLDGKLQVIAPIAAEPAMGNLEHRCLIRLSFRFPAPAAIRSVAEKGSDSGGAKTRSHSAP